MFKFLHKKKKVEKEKIKAFDSAIEAINVYIATSDWENAKQWLEEIYFKEKKSFYKAVERLENWKPEEKYQNEVIAEKAKDIFKRNEKIIQQLSRKIEKAEKKYNEEQRKKRLKVRFSKVKIKIKELIWKKKYNEASRLLSIFLEENKDDLKVIKYYNKQKNKIKYLMEKQRKVETEKIRKNTRAEAMSLIWETSKVFNKNDEKKLKEETSWFKKLWLYKRIKDWIKRRKLMDEVNILLEESDKVNNQVLTKRLENIHNWLTKEIKKKNILWFDLYWKILWADKISWDTFWMEEIWNKYKFFIWDATWHWIKAGFVVTLLSKLFRDNVKKPIKEAIYNINNWLKQDLSSRNFITWVFFEVDKKTKDLSFVWMWHEPLLIFRHKTNEVEKLIPGWLAAWIRIIKNIDDIKVKNIDMEDWDILLSYSDWIIESKNEEWEYYGIDKLAHNFKVIAENESNTKKIYEYLINDLKLFSWWTKFNDDVTVILLKRDELRDNIEKEEVYKIGKKQWLEEDEIKTIKWKTQVQIKKEIEDLKRKKELKRIIKNLENLYYTWETLKLKQECIRYIKEWYIHKKINFFLKKAIENEKNYSIRQKNKKMETKYNVLLNLYKKWDYSTVIREIEDVISKDWNI